jgi:hypothetical protein
VNRDAKALRVKLSSVSNAAKDAREFTEPTALVMSHDRLSAVMGALTGAGPAAPSAARELKYVRDSGRRVCTRAPGRRPRRRGQGGSESEPDSVSLASPKARNRSAQTAKLHCYNDSIAIRNSIMEHYNHWLPRGPRPYYEGDKSESRASGRHSRA